MIFRQLFDYETYTYTYLLADEKTKKAILIDPVLERVDRDLTLLKELGLDLEYILETHVHADHITGAYQLREKTAAKIVYSSKADVSCGDIFLKDGELLEVGAIKLKSLHTPGHTPTCISYYANGMVFTGDALLVRGTGRTDFQGGSSESLYESIQEKIYTLPKDTTIYPGHDYKGHMKSSVAEEQALNPRIREGVSKQEFVKTMSELKLAAPKKIDIAVPANQSCGRIS